MQHKYLSSWYVTSAKLNTCFNIIHELVAVNCTWGSWSAWTSCSTSCGCFERTRLIDVPAANGGTNCTGDDTETNGIIMLTGGTTWDGATVPVLEPTFVSINPNVPLPPSVNGTKNPITGYEFRRPAMFKTPGKGATVILMASVQKGERCPLIQPE